MQRMTLREANERLKEQGIEVSWGENSMDDFFSYYDNHYVPRMTAENCNRIGRFFAEDMRDIFC